MHNSYFGSQFGLECLLNILSMYTMIYKYVKWSEKEMLSEISSCFFILLFKEYSLHVFKSKHTYSVTSNCKSPIVKQIKQNGRD